MARSINLRPAEAGHYERALAAPFHVAYPEIMRRYLVKEIYYTLQGEGANTGRAAVFCRFAGCNLWSGREEDRAAAICQFCDTDFVGVDGPGGGRFDTAQDLTAAIVQCWPTKG